MAERPLPVRDELTRAYWDGARQEKLLIQRCAGCGTYLHPPRPRCPACGDEQLEWSEVSGRGRVYSWSVMCSPGNPGFEEKLPYAVLVVELEEQSGLRTIGNLMDAQPSDLRVGMPLEVCFEKVSADITLPQWRIAEEGAR